MQYSQTEEWGWELTFKQAEDLAKTLGQMKFVLQGTQGMFWAVVKYQELY